MNWTFLHPNEKRDRLHGDGGENGDWAAYLKGFSYKTEMLCKCTRIGMRIGERPFQFGLRKAGESKIMSHSPREILTSVFRLRLRDETTMRFLEFAFVGLSGFLINAVLLEILSRAAVPGRMAEGLATLLLSDTPLVRQRTVVLTSALFVLPYNWFVYNRIVWGTASARNAAVPKDGA